MPTLVGAGIRCMAGLRQRAGADLPQGPDNRSWLCPEWPFCGRFPGDVPDLDRKVQVVPFDRGRVEQGGVEGLPHGRHSGSHTHPRPVRSSCGCRPTAFGLKPRRGSGYIRCRRAGSTSAVAASDFQRGISKFDPTHRSSCPGPRRPTISVVKIKLVMKAWGERPSAGFRFFRCKADADSG